VVELFFVAIQLQHSSVSTTRLPVNKKIYAGISYLVQISVVYIILIALMQLVKVIQCY